MNKKESIIYHIRNYDNLKGMYIDIITIGYPLLGTFSTRIADWRGNGSFQLGLHTTPKCGLIETDKDFKSVKEAKEYYIENLIILLEDTLDGLRDK